MKYKERTAEIARQSEDSNSIPNVTPNPPSIEHAQSLSLFCMQIASDRKRNWVLWLGIRRSVGFTSIVKKGRVPAL